MDINAWAGSTFPLTAWSDDYDPAYDFARIIGDKTTSITVTRNGVAQTAQTVRIETMARGDTTITVNGRTHEIDAIVFGYNGHPTISDTDLQPGDRFVVDGARYEVIVVAVSLPDVLEAMCEVKT